MVSRDDRECQRMPSGRPIVSPTRRAGGASEDAFGRRRSCPMCRAAEMTPLERPVPYELLICPKCQTVISNFRRVASRGAFPV